MSSTNAELKQVTTFVLYGWGYPALFDKPNGDRFQNRLVRFPANAAPTIEGASQEALRGVLSKLKIVRQRYRNLLKHQSSDLNPVWVWIETPKQLSAQEMLSYREQFETWVEHTKVNENLIDRCLNSDLLAQIMTQEQTKGWRRNAIVVAVLTTVLTLAVIGVQ